MSHVEQPIDGFRLWTTAHMRSNSLHGMAKRRNTHESIHESHEKDQIKHTKPSKSPCKLRKGAIRLKNLPCERNRCNCWQTASIFQNRLISQGCAPATENITACRSFTSQLQNGSPNFFFFTTSPNEFLHSCSLIPENKRPSPTAYAIVQFIAFCTMHWYGSFLTVHWNKVKGSLG